MSAAIQIDSQGRRHYLRGNTYPIKDALRDAGCKWDGAEKAWWTGKREVAERLLAAAVTAPQVSSAPRSDAGKREETVGKNTAVIGRGSYKDQPCLVLWLGATSRGQGAKLAAIDGGRIWWADAALVTITKRYAERECPGGYGRGTVREPMTFGRLQLLRERSAKERAAEKAEEKREKHPLEQPIQRRCADRHDAQYRVGCTIRCGHVVGGGGPDGHYFTVLSVQKPSRNEDMGFYDWTETARVRPATDEESGPVAAEIAAEIAAASKTEPARE